MSTLLRLTVDEYDRMIEHDVFDKSRNKRIELIHGQLREVSQHEPPHEHINSLLSEWSLLNAPRDRVWIRNQNSIGIPPFSVPRPDIAWVVKKSYRRQRPLPDDVLLVIEVSEFPLGDEQEYKFVRGSLYAVAGLAEYWIVNIPARCVLAHRNPQFKSSPSLRRAWTALEKRGVEEADAKARDSRIWSYRDVQSYGIDETVRPLAFPDLELPVAELFVG